jgi:hypothetical protein
MLCFRRDESKIKEMKMYVAAEIKYTAFRQGGKGIFFEHRVTRFSATTLPLASESAVVR